MGDNKEVGTGNYTGDPIPSGLPLTLFVYLMVSVIAAVSSTICISIM